jgi:Fic family protein
MAKYIYQQKNWTNFTWNECEISVLLAQVRYLQGRVLGKMSALGFALQKESTFATLTLDVLKSSEIEGEKLNRAAVRSSIARHLGIEIAGAVYADKNTEGVVEMMLDATQNFSQPLTEDRLFSWHSALFPSKRSGMHKIAVGCYRTGEMQIVSGALGNEKVHYEAPKPEVIPAEMSLFLKWLNTENKQDTIIKAAIAHLWFVTLHPFDDGNGRIARTITDMLLARSDESSQRFYSMSAQIQKERKKYYAALEKTQHSSSDITLWLNWFLTCLNRALLATEQTLQNILYKAVFWNKNAKISFNDRQKLMLNKLLNGDFRGKLQSSKWAKMTKCSSDTALRDIKDLMEKGVLQQEAAGRNTNYELKNEIFLD